MLPTDLKGNFLYMLVLPILFFVSLTALSVKYEGGASTTITDEIAAIDTVREPEPTPITPLKEAEEAIWRNDQGVAGLVWTTSDLYLVDSDSSRHNGLWRVNSEIEAKDLRSKNIGADCEFSKQLEVLSVVDNFISVSDLKLLVCGNSSKFLRIETHKVSELKNKGLLRSSVVKLTDIFSTEDIFDGLVKNGRIERLLALSDRRPSHLPELLEIIDDKFSRRIAGDFALSTDLDNFAFLGTSNNSVTVRLFLMPTSGYNASTAEYLDIELNIPNSLNLALKNADQRIDGFLNKDFEAVSKGMVSTFHNQ